MPKHQDSSTQKLKSTAQSALLWAGGFTFLRDISQFAVMIILVRLLSPADYGTMALVQSIIGMAAVFSFQTFSSHALQLRDPSEIDWQTHFSAAIAINSLISILVLLIAAALWFFDTYRGVSAPLAALSIVFVIEAPGTLRHRMLEANHLWGRYRSLLILGTLLGLVSGLIVAILGGGVWALVIQPAMFGIPAVIDLFIFEKFRPDWTWNKARWSETFRFGLDRVGSSLAGRGRNLNESIFLTGVYDLATLGVFSRANGLANLLAGRLGTTVMAALYPVITRADRGSERFKRLSSLLLRGVVWITVPAASMLTLIAEDIVLFIYGPKWEAVVPLLPIAAALTAAIGIWNVLTSLLVANEGSRQALWMDVIAAVSAIALAFWLIPSGADTYLFGLLIHALLSIVLTSLLLVHHSAITILGLVTAFTPALVATSLGVCAVEAVRTWIGTAEFLVQRLALDMALFSLTYVAVLRVAFHNATKELLMSIPGGATMSRYLRMR